MKTCLKIHICHREMSTVKSLRHQGRDDFHDADMYEEAYANYLRALEWWEKSFGTHDS